MQAKLGLLQAVSAKLMTALADPKTASAAVSSGAVIQVIRGQSVQSAALPAMHTLSVSKAVLAARLFQALNMKGSLLRGGPFFVDDTLIIFPPAHNAAGVFSCARDDYRLNVCANHTAISPAFEKAYL